MFTFRFQGEVSSTIHGHAAEETSVSVPERDQDHIDIEEWQASTAVTEDMFDENGYAWAQVNGKRTKIGLLQYECEVLLVCDLPSFDFDLRKGKVFQRQNFDSNMPQRSCE